MSILIDKIKLASAAARAQLAASMIQTLTAELNECLAMVRQETTFGVDQDSEDGKKLLAFETQLDDYVELLAGADRYCPKFDDLLDSMRRLYVVEALDEPVTASPETLRQVTA